MSAQEDLIVPLSIQPIKDTLVLPPLINTVVQDTIASDSIQIDTLNKKDPLLLDIIKYKAKDYVKLSQKDQKIYLYNEAEIYYQDTELKAGIIVMDYVKNEVYAGRMRDSLGNYSQLPYFKQGTNEVTPDSIRFNFDTQKAIIWNSRTEQQAGLGQLGSDNMKVLAQITKKENDSVYFLHEGKLTTSKDTIDPDYFIRIKKAKFVPGKKVIAGFSNLYIVDVPTPIAMPFAYFPLTTGRSPGLMMPSFGNIPDRGYFLQNGGYYVPFGDYADLLMTGDFYTNGSYGIRTQSVYTKRYKFRGNVNFRYERLINSQKGFDDYSSTRIYNLQISHSQDAKSNPNSRFSASVNLGSSQYYRNSLNVINTPNTQNNNLSSSISYSKTFPNYPSVNISLTATHNQNTNTQSINMTLPTFQGSLERIYPFAKRDGIKKGVLQNINMQYNVSAVNRIQTTDSLFFKPGMFKDAKVGARHTIPISTNFKVAKHFSISMGTSYEDVWTLETFKRGRDSELNKEVVLDTVKGFDRYGKYNFSTSLGTTLYGTFNFGEDKRIQAIRHVMRPSISYSTAPSFDQYYEDILDENGNEYINSKGEVERYSRFEGTLNGAPGLTSSSSMSFSLQNTLEAKVKDRDSTVLEPKKVSILNSLNLSTSYNFKADSLKLSTIRLTGGTNILNKKMSINFGANLDPYAIDNNGTRINTFNIDNGGSLLRLTRANMNLSYSLSSETFGKKGGKEPDKNEEDENSYAATSGGRTDGLFGTSDDYDNRSFNEDDSGDVENPNYGNKLPWDLRMAFSTGYNNSNRQNEFSNASLMFSGNITLTPMWKVGFNSGYDFKNKGFTLTRLNFTRDLKSFVMRFNWTPFGTYKQWNFFIGIKSSILQDLKWENRSQRAIRR
ncbi:lipopolysaccharide assembly outer membrane protein LptD (OstA) [Saonia flava]|uniref:Lipopolysaccharide assembly outer membrane protein LptD (OstA) n=1 Tax=Saonia flava TaxID=523696 RepID=A0A846R0B1_9FLAO|nr:putative LPS assembly protein LptD [Saonia flava]NJB70309.1 lipopolysaccharide assembly outer membrane protein LptD (OstA) [Saonia flava]